MSLSHYKFYTVTCTFTRVLSLPTLYSSIYPLHMKIKMMDDTENTIQSNFTYVIVYFQNTNLLLEEDFA